MESMITYPRSSRVRRWLSRTPERTLAVAALGVLALGSVACGASTSASPSGSHSAKGYTIDFVPGTTTNPFYISMHAGAASEAQKLGVNLVWQGGTEWSPSSQIPVVSSLFADHPNALVIVPTDVTALKAPIEQYVNAHIPVVTADTTITDTSILSSRITCNNVEGGKMAADALASLVNDQGEVAVINNEPGVSTDDQRQDGFAQELQAKYPNMTIVATEYDNESVTTAEAQAAALVLAYPKLVGIFGIDVPSGEGLGQEIQSANLAGKVFGVSYDAVAAEVSFLKAGDLSALVMQQPAAEGSLAVQYAYDLITGQKGSVKDNVVMSDVLATTATASDPTISQYFYVNSLNGS